MAPPMGDPVSAPMDAKKKEMPVRVPISRRSLICAMTAGSKETNPPDANPNTAPYAIVVAVDVPGIHSASVKIPDSADMKTMILKRPKRSPRKPGRIRPGILLIHLAVVHFVTHAGAVSFQP